MTSARRDQALTAARLGKQNKLFMTTGTVVLGTIVIGFMIADRDWHRERAYGLAMAGRGQYR